MKQHFYKVTKLNTDTNTIECSVVVADNNLKQVSFENLISIKLIGWDSANVVHEEFAAASTYEDMQCCIRGKEFDYAQLKTNKHEKEAQKE